MINSELNRLLLKTYKFDVRTSCASLKDLELMLERLLVETTEELYKKQPKSTPVRFHLYPVGNSK